MSRAIPLLVKNLCSPIPDVKHRDLQSINLSNVLKQLNVNRHQSMFTRTFLTILIIEKLNTIFLTHSVQQRMALC